MQIACLSSLCKICREIEKFEREYFTQVLLISVWLNFAPLSQTGLPHFCEIPLSVTLQSKTGRDGLVHVQSIRMSVSFSVAEY